MTAVFPEFPGREWPVTKSAEWATTVQETASGREVRVSGWLYPRWRFQMTHAYLSQGQSDEIMGFFAQQRGQLRPFLLRDPTDWTRVGQVLGLGDGSTTKFRVVRDLGVYAGEPVGAVMEVVGWYRGPQALAIDVQAGTLVCLSPAWSVSASLGLSAILSAPEQWALVSVGTEVPPPLSADGGVALTAGQAVRVGLLVDQARASASAVLWRSADISVSASADIDPGSLSVTLSGSLAAAATVIDVGAGWALLLVSLTAPVSDTYYIWSDGAADISGSHLPVPVADWTVPVPLRVYVSGVEIPYGSWSILNTVPGAAVTLTLPPPAYAPVSVDMSYYYACRFAVDRQAFQVIGVGLWQQSETLELVSVK